MAAEQIRCVRALVYKDALTNEKMYDVLDYDAGSDRVRVRDDRGRTRWYPASCFTRVAATSPTLASFTLDDPITDPAHDCIEVTVQLADGRRRWCFFVTASWLLAAVSGAVESKTVEKQGARLAQMTYLGESLTTDAGEKFGLVNVPHMIVVSKLSAAVVGEALRHLAGQRELERSTLPL